MICENEFYELDGMFYPEGDYVILLQTAYGCDSIINLSVEYIEFDEVIVEETLCFPDCFMLGGGTYCTSGTFTEFVSDPNPPFCDVPHVLELTVIQVNLLVDIIGELSCSSGMVELNAENSIIEDGDGSVQIIWSDPNGMQVGSDLTIEVTDPGIYTLTVIVTAPNGLICADMIDIEIEASDAQPDLEFFDFPFICAGDSINLATLNFVDNNNTGATITFHSDTPADSDNELDSPVVSPTESTIYYVLATSGNCISEIGITVDIDEGPDIQNTTFPICGGESIDLDTVSLNVQFLGGGSVTFHYDSPPDQSNLLGSNLLTPVQDTVIYVLATNDSQCSSEGEITIDIIDVPDNTFSVTNPICLDATSSVLYSGSSTVDEYIWDFGSASGGGTGAGAHDLNWDSSGTYTITLQTVSQGCASEVDTMVVEVVDPLIPPIINCDSSNDTIIFSWSDVIGASGYSINILSGPTSGFQINDTTYIITGNNPGSFAEIELTVGDPGPCNDISVSEMCQALDCPGVVLSINQEGPFCSMDSDPVFLVGGISGNTITGTSYWEGPGLVDTLSGIFVPQQAGPGSHLITFYYQEFGCMFSEDIIIEVNENPSADFTVTSPICMDDFSMISYSGNASSTAIYNWFFSGGTPGISDPRDAPFQVSWNTPGLKLIRLEVEEMGCLSEIVEIMVQVDEPIQPPVVNCNSTDSSIQFEWEFTPGVDGYTVTQINGPAGQQVNDSTYLVDNLQPNTQITIEITAFGPTVCGDAVMQYTCIAQDCPDVTLNIGQQLPMCWSQNMAPIQLDVQVVGSPGGGTVFWDSPYVMDPTAGLFDASTAGPGVHTVLILYQEGNCQFINSIDIELNENPMADAGPDIELNCSLDFASLGGMNNSVGPDIQYQWTGPVTDPNNSVTSTSATGMFILEVSDAVTGCFSLDTVLVSMDDNIVDGASVSTIQTSCASPTGAITVSNVINGTPPYTILMNGVGIQQGTVQTALTSGDYLIEIEDANGCTWDTTIVIQPISGSLASPGTSLNEISCVNPLGSIAFGPFMSGTPPYEVFVNGLSYGSSNQVDDLLPGSYDVILTDVNGCSWDTTFTLDEFEPVSIDLGEDVQIDVGQWAEIIPVITGNVSTLVWGPTSLTEDCGECPVLFVQPDETVTVYGTVVDPDGCTSTDSLLITVLPPNDIFIPNVFSPNEDGINDFFYVQGPPHAELITEFNIFNRWGALVFSAENIPPNQESLGWDGWFKGEPVNPAVFVYTVSVQFADGDIINYSGDITLIK
jgi:gliding motility-associated-like protein